MASEPQKNEKTEVIETAPKAAPGQKTLLREAPVVTAPVAAAVPVPPKKRNPFVVLSMVVAVGMVLVGGYVFATRNDETTDDAQVWSDLVPVATRVAGQVVHVAVVENQQVKKGELLAQLDDADYVAKVKEAEAELAVQQAQAKAADAQVTVVAATSKGGFSALQAAVSGSSVGVGGAEAQVQAARAGLLRAQADLHKADTDLKRAKELRAANAVPQQQLDDAQIAFEMSTAAEAQAKAQLSVAEEMRNQAQSRVSEARGRLDQSSRIDAQNATAQAQADLAHARVKSAEAALDLARLQLSYTKIMAPFDGFASKLTVHDGQLAAIGQPVLQLVPTTTYVVANFKETQIGRMKPGQKVEIKIDAFSRKLEGKVESLAGGTGSSFALLPADNASGNFVKVVQRIPVRIAWVNPPADLPLRAGLSADVPVDVQ